MKFKFLALALVLAGTVAATAADPPPVSPDEAQIRKNVQAYADAYNKKDAKALAAFWTDEAVYTNRSAGTESVGPAEIQKELEAEFAKKKSVKLDVTVDSVEFVSPGVAIERGVSTILAEGKPEGVISYAAVHVKRNGKWLIDRITEDDLPSVPAAVERLQQLAWMIGSWENAEDDGSVVKLTCEWSKNQTFMIRSFVVAIPNQDELTGIQVIGWDAAARTIRSWAFDSDGGFNEATWTKKDNRWTINAAATLPDGRRASSINTIKLDGKDSFSWQVTGREVDGEILPNLPEIKIKRK